MARYIDRNKAIAELYEAYDYEYPTASGDFDEYASIIVPNVLRQMPTADVVPKSVISEIFAEIDGLMLDGEIGGKYPAKVINPAKYAELKKKFTEGK